MGALTSKSFPFELRSWEIKKLKHFDPTNSFGYNLKILTSNKKIVQVEPNYSSEILKNVFINDKSRHFFNKTKQIKNKNFSLNFFKKTIKILIKTLYIFELNYLRNSFFSYFFLIYENLSIDILCLLLVIKQKYFFIKLKTFYCKKFNNNIESNFLFNKIRLKNSNFCLLINVNTKKETTDLNFYLKQRILKGNYSLLNLGSFFKFKYNLKTLGHTVNTLKNITEGTNFNAQTFKSSKNPNIITNSELIKRHDNELLSSILIYLNKFIKYFKTNILNKSIHETNTLALNNLINFSKTPLLFSSFYFLHTLNFKNRNLTDIFNVNVLYSTKKNKLLLVKKNCFNQNNKQTLKKFNKLTNYFYLPVRSFFENSELFINNEGLFKKSSQLFLSNNFKSSWKILRKTFNNLTKKLSYIFKTNFFLTFNTKNRFHFLKIFYLFYFCKKITNSIFILNCCNTFFMLTKKNFFNNKKFKLINTKINFWLNDFFIGGKDDFSWNSLVLIKNSNINRSQQTNFF